MRNKAGKCSTFHMITVWILISTFEGYGKLFRLCSALLNSRPVHSIKLSDQSCLGDFQFVDRNKPSLPKPSPYIYLFTYIACGYLNRITFSHRGIRIGEKNTYPLRVRAFILFKASIYLCYSPFFISSRLSFVLDFSPRIYFHIKTALLYSPTFPWHLSFDPQSVSQSQ